MQKLNKPRSTQNFSDKFNESYQSGLDPNSQYNYIYQEKEVQKIIQDYNTQIKELVEDNQILQEKNNFLSEKAKSTEPQNFNTINQKLESLKQKLQENAKNLESQFESKIVESQQKISDAIKKENDKNVNISNSLNMKDVQPEIMNVLQMEQKNFENSKKEKIELKLQLIQESSSQNKIKICAHCKEKFSPLENKQNSCQYHPGRLKYYSCLGCGGDEYYSCCMKCYNCSKGCRFDKHVAQE